MISLSVISKQHSLSSGATLWTNFKLVSAVCDEHDSYIIHIFQTQELANTQELPTLLEATLHKLKQISEKYSSKSALGKRVFN